MLTDVAFFLCRLRTHEPCFPTIGGRLKGFVASTIMGGIGQGRMRHLLFKNKQQIKGKINIRDIPIFTNFAHDKRTENVLMPRIVKDSKAT